MGNAPYENGAIAESGLLDAEMASENLPLETGGEDPDIEIKIGAKEMQGLRRNEAVENELTVSSLAKLCASFDEGGLLSEKVLIALPSEEANAALKKEVLGSLQLIFGAAEAASYAKQTLEAPNPDQVVGANIRDKVERDGHARIWGMRQSELGGLTVSSQMLDRLQSIKIGDTEYGTPVAWTREIAGGKKMLHLIDAQGRELQLVLDPKGSVLSADVVVSNGRNLSMNGESVTANSADSYLVGLDAYKALAAGRYPKESGVNPDLGGTVGEMATDNDETGRDVVDIPVGQEVPSESSTSVFEQTGSTAVVEEREAKPIHMQEFADYYAGLEERSGQKLPDLGFDRSPEQVKRDFLRRGNSFFEFRNVGENGDLTNAGDVWQNTEASLRGKDGVKDTLSEAFSVGNMDNPKYDRLRAFGEVAAMIDERRIRNALVASGEPGAGKFESSRSVYETQVLGKLKAELKAAVLEADPSLVNIPTPQLETMLDSNLKGLVGFSRNIGNWSEPKV